MFPAAAGAIQIDEMISKTRIIPKDLTFRNQQFLNLLTYKTSPHRQNPMGAVKNLKF
jgi:hypothetical protein